MPDTKAESEAIALARRIVEESSDCTSALWDDNMGAICIDLARAVLSLSERATKAEIDAEHARRTKDQARAVLSERTERYHEIADGLEEKAAPGAQYRAGMERAAAIAEREENKPILAMEIPQPPGWIEFSLMPGRPTPCATAIRWRRMRRGLKLAQER